MSVSEIEIQLLTNNVIKLKKCRKGKANIYCGCWRLTQVLCWVMILMILIHFYNRNHQQDEIYGPKNLQKVDRYQAENITYKMLLII